ncbi:MAG: glycosyltransferase family 4 protein [Ignavibacteria bacterium]|nr:glycosyltransferase family 4 protein [Ignavibacteria bacterium]MCC7159594.1 glycosyltransferase family 4 protein [Ignavibacteria bacterium]
MRKLNILLLNALDIYGGGEYFVYQTALSLKMRGHNIWVSCRDNNFLYKKCIDNTISVFPTEYPEPNRKNKLFKIANRLKSFINENKIDIVHSNTTYDRTAGAFAARLANVKHVTNAHSFESLQHNLTHWYRNRYLIDHFFADGMRIRDLLINEDKIDEKKISMIYLGLNSEDIGKDNISRLRIRNEYDIKDDEILIGNAARMVPFKGQEFLIRAFGNVLSAFPKARLMIVGDGELSEDLKNLSKEIGTNGGIVFAGFKDNLKEMYSAFDIYAHTSVEGGGEAFPFAVLHALAAGLPVTATNVGDVSAMVNDGENGFLVPDMDVGAIAEKLKILTGDKALRVRMGTESFKLQREKFTMELMTDNIEKVYLKVLDEIRK